MYAISRIQAKPGIWCWAVSFRRRGTAYFRQFYFVGRGGSKKALAAAVAWRDRQLKRVRELSKREFCQIVRSSNRSGEPGVYFLRPREHQNGVWQAQLRLPDGRKITKTFSVHKFGHQEAFKRAVAARRDMLRLVANRPYLHHKVAKRFAARKSTLPGGRAPPKR